MTSEQPNNPESAFVESNFKDFCIARYADSDCVSESKLVEFLDYTINQPLFKKLFNSQYDDSEWQKEMEKGYDEAVRIILSLSRLWEQQRNEGLNSNLYPNGAQLEKAMRFFTKSRQDFLEPASSKTDDLGNNASQQELTDEELDKVTEKCLDWADINGKQATQRWVMYCSSQVCRGFTMKASQFRTIRLKDLKVLHLEEMTRVNCGPLFAIFLQSPSLYSENVKCCLALRHDNVFACPIGAIAMQLFWRWVICKDRFPNFERPDTWKSMGLCRLDHGESEIPKMYIYNRKYAFFRNMGISAAKTPNEFGHSYEITFKSQTESLLLEQSSLEGLLRRGGVLEELESRAYTLNAIGKNRKQKQPPNALIKSVFTNAEKWLLQEFNNPGMLDSDAIQFLEFMNEIKIVFLQDSVYYKSRFPNNPIWRNSIFKMKEYQEFEEDFNQDLKIDNVKAKQILKPNEYSFRGINEFTKELVQMEQDMIEKLYKQFEETQRNEIGQNFDERAFEYIKTRINWQYSTVNDWPVRFPF